MIRQTATHQAATHQAATHQAATHQAGGRRWIGGTITVRAVLVTCLVALVSVVITTGVAVAMVLRAANDEVRAVLADKAKVAAEAIERRDNPLADQREELRARRVAMTLRDQGIEAVRIRDGRPDVAGLPPRIIDAIADGSTVSQRVMFQGTMMLAEGRPAGDGDGIVLLQPAATVKPRTVLSRLWLAIGAGLAAGLVAGTLLARRLGQPLREVAVAARRLSGGDRAARAPTDAPTEIADVSIALNELAAALALSENRQRTFLMSVSHELRTPLTTIKGYAEALADGVVTADATQRVGQTMLAESEHLGRLVEDLLVLARLEADDFPLELMPVELTALLAKVEQSWAARARAAGAELRVELPGHEIMVRTDPGRLRQVIDGLVDNALRVVPAGAPIVLAVRPSGSPSVGDPFSGDPFSGDPLSGDTFSGDAGAILEVRDGGPGFTDDDLAVVFERGALYERYKGVRAVGSGLGLALAQRLVRRLGATIEAGHAAEGGARFTVRLPA